MTETTKSQNTHNLKLSVVGQAKIFDHKRFKLKQTSVIFTFIHHQTWILTLLDIYPMPTPYELTTCYFFLSNGSTTSQKGKNYMKIMTNIFL
jgi:hypothetical protein